MVVTRSASARARSQVSADDTDKVRPPVEPKRNSQSEFSRSDECALFTLLAICLIGLVVAIVSIENRRTNAVRSTPDQQYSTLWLSIYDEVNLRLDVCDHDVVCALTKAVNDNALDRQLVKLLIEYDVDLTMIHNHVFLAAVILNRTTIVEEMLQSEFVNVTHLDNYVLREAVSLNLPEIVDLLLQDNRIRSTVNFTQLLEFATEFNHPETVRLLTKYRPRQ